MYTRNNQLLAMIVGVPPAVLAVVFTLAMTGATFAQGGTFDWSSIIPPAMNAQTNSTTYSPLVGGGGSTGGGTVGGTATAPGGFYYELLYNVNFTGSQVSGASAPSNSAATLFGGTWLDTGLEATNSTGTVSRLVPVNPSSVAIVPWSAGTTDNIVLVGWSANLGATWPAASNLLAQMANGNAAPIVAQLAGQNGFFGVSAAGYLSPNTSPDAGATVFGTAPTTNGLPIRSPATQLYLIGGPPAVTVSPAVTNFVYGSSVMLTANATGSSPLAYQWYDNLTNAMAGQTGASLTLNVPPVTSSGNYTIIVTNAFGRATNFATVTVIPAPDEYVTNTNDDNSEGTLRYAINYTTNGATINFAPNLSGTTILLTNGELFITNNLTIVGLGPNNLAVDGNVASRVFHISSNIVVSISGLTITNGLASDSSSGGPNGGGIFNDDATLIVSNCTVSGNSASTGFGGGIFNVINAYVYTGAILSVINSTFDDNMALSGGGIAIGDGSGIVTITNSTFSGNLATNGGGVFISSSYFTVTITHSTFSGNVATNGGGIFSSGDLTIADSVISNNVANGVPGEGLGGGIYNDIGLLLVNNSILSSNSVNGEGGGIYNIAVGFAGSNVQIQNSTLSGNSANGVFGIGGGIFSIGEYGGGTGVFIENSTVSDNLGYGIVNFANDGSRATLAFIDSTLSGNIGGGIENQGFNGGSVNQTIFSSTLSGNSGDTIYSYGIDSGSVTLTIGNTILNVVAPGQNINGYTDNLGTVTNITKGYNLCSDAGNGIFTNTTDQINTDPKLGPLQDNGGPTFTHAPLPGSPAIDKGKNLNSIYGPFYTDQRGQPRTYDNPGIPNAAGGDGTDIGALELIPPMLAITYANNQAVVSWLPMVAGWTWTLQTNINLATGSWGNYLGPVVNHSVTNAPPTGNLFFRLTNP